MKDLANVVKQIRDFREARNWGQFHNPKDMSIAISIEANELLEIFLWKSREEVAARAVSHRKEITDEVADIGIYLVGLADIMGIDLVAAMEEKIAKNDVKYPAEKVRGSSKKYTEYSHGKESAE